MGKDEDVDPEKAVFLPLGYDDFYGIEKEEKKESIWMRTILAIENACKPWFDKLDKWTEEQKKINEEEKKAIEEDLELIEAEIGLEEAIEDMEELLRIREKEEEKKAKMGLLDEEDDDNEGDGDYMTSVTKQDEKAPAKVVEVPAEVEEEDDDDWDDEEDDNSAQSSFGSVEQGQTTDQQKGKPGKSPFSASSLAFASSSLISAVSYDSQLSFDASFYT